MYNENDYIQLSAIQHFVFCKRQCALIHIEQVWDENVLTAGGRIMHEKAHEEQFETRGNLRIERGMPLSSKELGLSGKADLIEFHKSTDGKWEPFPVECKRGKPKSNDCDKVQLCAQAMCLEDMLKVKIERGAIFYGKTRHRMDVEFNEALRRITIDTAEQLHEFIKAGKTPPPECSKRCESCSIVETCMPKSMTGRTKVAEYFQKMLAGE